jgi:hypothetical protein
LEEAFWTYCTSTVVTLTIVMFFCTTTVEFSNSSGSNSLSSGAGVDDTCSAVLVDIASAAVPLAIGAAVACRGVVVVSGSALVSASTLVSTSTHSCSHA